MAPGSTKVPPISTVISLGSPVLTTGVDVTSSPSSVSVGVVGTPLDPLRVITGAWVSTTITVRVLGTAALPEASEAL